MSKLPERLTKYLPVLGTSKQSNINTFRSNYGGVSSVEIIAMDPENVNAYSNSEPRDIDPTKAARFKTREILKGFKDKQGREIVVFGSDVVFEKDGFRYLKPDTEIRPKEELIQETVDWYCTGSFIVHWLIAFTVETADGLSRVTVLDVEGSYKEPLKEDLVKDSFDENINARIPLVEANGEIEFTLSNSYHNEKVPISQELAKQLVIDRILPIALLNSLLEDRAISVEDSGEVWDFIILDFFANL